MEENLMQTLSNLAQARLGTLEEDLGMKGTDFNLATSILFVVSFLLGSIKNDVTHGWEGLHSDAIAIESPSYSCQSFTLFRLSDGYLVSFHIRKQQLAEVNTM